MKALDDAKFSGTKEVDEKLKISSSKLQPWIDENVPNAGKIQTVEQFVCPSSWYTHVQN